MRPQARNVSLKATARDSARRLEEEKKPLATPRNDRISISFLKEQKQRLTNAHPPAPQAQTNLQGSQFVVIQEEPSTVSNRPSESPIPKQATEARVAKEAESKQAMNVTFESSKPSVVEMPRPSVMTAFSNPQGP